MPAPTPDTSLVRAIDTIPAGPWAVGVSGGADSVALLRLLGRRPDILPHIVHLDHQTRGQASTADAQFVAALASNGSLPCTIQRRDVLERAAEILPRNPSSRYRRLRLILFGNVVREYNLRGVLLAHHADDQAETVLHRLLRNASASGLAGMSSDRMIGTLRILRPLLDVRRNVLRAYLESERQPWREDDSNASPKYLRNRLRAFLADKQELTAALLQLSCACDRHRRWLTQNAPKLAKQFPLSELSDLPSVLSRSAARAWLIARGVPQELMTPELIARLLNLNEDAAAPPRQQFPGGLTVCRRQKTIFAAEPTHVAPPRPQ